VPPAKTLARLGGRVVYEPVGHKPAIHVAEVLDASVIASAYVFFRDVVPAEQDSELHARDGEFGSRNPDVEEMHRVPVGTKSFDRPAMSQAGERRLEREVGARSPKIIQALQHDAPCLDRGGGRVEARQPLRDHVRVDERADLERADQQPRGERALPGAVRAGEDDRVGLGGFGHFGSG
jgi:hypothetical protein